MKAIQLIVSVGLVALVSGGCSKEKHSLAEVDKQMIPYKMGKTIRFVNERGRLSTLPVEEDETEWRETTILNKPVIFERRKVYLYSEDHFYWIHMRVNAWTTEYENYRFIDIAGASEFMGDFRIYYDSKGQFQTEGGQYQYVYDSMEIYGKVYYNVCFVRGWEDAPRGLYYNTDYGILQVKEGEKAIFTLVP